MRHHPKTLGLSGVSFVLLLNLLVAPALFAFEHPGNVCVVGDDLRVAVPAAWTAWQATDVDGNVVAHGTAQNGVAQLGTLPVGYFEVREKPGGDRITAAVLAKTTTSDSTPIAIDAAMSWFYSEPEKLRDACALCRMAGVKWVRDRASWPELQPTRDSWAPQPTRYELAMKIQHEAGLKILRVNHASAPWANKNQSHFPEDLRNVYHFYRGLAERWKGFADAIEPWNEPDIELFGGHTGCEIASFQKAAYLGLKAGNPNLPVCESVFAIDRAETLNEFTANAVFPYFDRYNLHHYTALPAYPRVYARHRAASGGRPMWTTEFNLMVNWADEKTKEPSEDDLRVQAFRVSKVFAEALHEGIEKAFYFILGDYVERDLQYGLVHQDLTPRPAYVAFAAVGRLLNAAKPLGRVDLGDDKLKGYLFQTEIDGAGQETLVAWSETKPTSINIKQAQKAYDYLGRQRSLDGKVELTRATIFLILPRGAASELDVQPPPEKAKWLDGTPSPVVLQLIGKGNAAKSTFELDASNSLQLAAYNFGSTPVKGSLSVEGAAASVSELAIAAKDRTTQTLHIARPGSITVHLNLDNGQHVIVLGTGSSVKK